MDKERNKFAKLDSGGKKNKQKIQQRSLEKQAKPKKHSKPKPAPVVEIEDIMEELPSRNNSHHHADNRRRLLRTGREYPRLRLSWP